LVADNRMGDRGAGLACIVALSRTMLGVHYVTDVVAGLVVGWSWCLLWAIVLGIVPARR